jgi:hypothetical protein
LSDPNAIKESEEASAAEEKRFVEATMRAVDTVISAPVLFVKRRPRR